MTVQLYADELQAVTDCEERMLPLLDLQILGSSPLHRFFNRN